MADIVQLPLAALCQRCYNLIKILVDQLNDKIRNIDLNETLQFTIAFVYVVGMSEVFIIKKNNMNKNTLCMYVRVKQKMLQCSERFA